MLSGKNNYLSEIYVIKWMYFNLQCCIIYIMLKYSETFGNEFCLTINIMYNLFICLRRTIFANI